MKGFKGRNQTTWILVGILAIALVFLYSRLRVEGFGTSTIVEYYHYIPPKASNEQKTFKIKSEDIKKQKGKIFKAIILQRYNSKTKKYDTIDMNKFTSKSPTLPKVDLISKNKVSLINCNWNYTLLAPQARLPLPTSDAAFDGGIIFKNLDLNPLGIVNDGKDTNGKNLKIILVFTDESISSISNNSSCLTLPGK